MSGGIRVREACGWVEHGAAVYVASLPDGPPLVLEGTGALVWRAVLGGGGIDDVVVRVAAGAGESAEAVAAGVTAFVDGLVAAGVLEVLGPHATGGE